jgi:hypothetical protein
MNDLIMNEFPKTDNIYFGKIKFALNMLNNKNHPVL